jgi:hypothetical protein
MFIPIVLNVMAIDPVLIPESSLSLLCVLGPKWLIEPSWLSMQSGIRNQQGVLK